MTCSELAEIDTDVEVGNRCVSGCHVTGGGLVVSVDFVSHATECIFIVYEYEHVK